MLQQNIDCLQKRNPRLLQLLEQVADSDRCHLVLTKAGAPTLQVCVNEQMMYIHSAYDPIREAERLVEQRKKEIELHDHIFFYGVGLGYHIEKVMELFPDKTYTLYEPNIGVFTKYVSTRPLVCTENVRYVIVETDENVREQFLAHFSSTMKTKVMLFSLPSYERIWKEQFSMFIERFKQTVQARRMSLHAEAAFGKRWVLNSLMNLRETLRTPCIFSKRPFFEGKPVIIVSAGPSLHEEYDNLRYIKNNGLAYIVAVGSANRALVANDILPHAVCTYDPQDHNFSVFSDMIERQKDIDVPMIYGTSVGYETLERYRGPKLHMVTTQDTVSPYYSHVDRSHIVDDAFSIAIVTYHLFAKMGANPIIFVGQNLAFLNNLYYANDIKRGANETAEVLEFEKHGLTLVDDVYGNKITTNASLNQMRLLLERYIRAYPHIETLNTTKGGANISGAPFVPLETVIEKRLKEKFVVENWYESTKGVYDYAYLSERVQAMKKARRKLVLLFSQAFERVNELEKTIQMGRKHKLVQSLDRAYQLVQDTLKNDFYRVYIYPATQAQATVLVQHMELDNDNIEVKVREFTPLFSNYFQLCLQTYNELAPLVDERLHTYTQLDEGWIQYDVNTDMFQLSSEWQKEEITIKRRALPPHILSSYYIASKKGAHITFTFKGKAFRLLGGTHMQAGRLNIVIDGYRYKCSARDVHGNEMVVPQLYEIVFEKANLQDRVHTVEIELIEDKPFIFQGIQVYESNTSKKELTSCNG